jgi:hypothetical protein
MVALALVDCDNRCEAPEIKARIGNTLIIGDALETGTNNRVRRLRKVAIDLGKELRKGGRNAQTHVGARRWALRDRRSPGRRRLEAGREGREARRNSDAAAPDRHLERRALEWQRFCPCECAEKNRTDDTARRFGEPFHVEGVEFFRRAATRFEQTGVI